LNSLFSGDLKKEISGYEPQDLFREHARKSNTDDPLSVIQYIDFKTYLPECILTKVDRASMAVALEARVPILDHTIVEYAATIPSSLKLHGQDQKHIFKEALRGVLPHDIMYRKKQGFEMPISEWLRGGIRDFAEDLMFNTGNTSEILDTSALKKTWNLHQRGIQENANFFWSVLTFLLWQRKFMQ
jgi:asparagine synthase (glutamine-hydrolysing)